MVNDVSRSTALLELAGMIENGETLMKEHGHTIRKYVALVGERDAGPTDKVKEENTQLRAKIEQLQAELEGLKARVVDYDVFRESAIRAQRANTGLRESNTQLAKRNADLVKKHDEMVDLYAEADQRAKAHKTALDEIVEGQAVKTTRIGDVELIEPNTPEGAR